jgi:hypothetical protein
VRKSIFIRRMACVPESHFHCWQVG